MASIFTWEPDTPRVSSPWLQGLNDGDVPSPGILDKPEDGDHANRKIPRLQAEPQDGPVEYKLHLLLRTRRKFSYASTSAQAVGVSAHAISVVDAQVSLNAVSASPQLLPSNSVQQTRQHRLEQLTTQLLWRLQQSSPHHSSSATNIILPSLPEALPELRAPVRPSKLLHGLEESQGALYEIGVSDDGTLIGLAEDELQESLNNLTAMAACLGCSVDVLRKEIVGRCEWVEDRQIRRGPLYVAEAFIKPCLQSASPQIAATEKTGEENSKLDQSVLPAAVSEQLRITLTGPTMSGKSTLLGTLTTSTLDTGRGKSRLSMLKHRHEINSGITSSVTQELLGYHDAADGDVEVINYATENTASWIDMHAAAAGTRLVFVSDSAGHPRYRRTTVRSLIGWKPHWTLLCVPANDQEDVDTSDKLGSIGAETDLTAAQLDLCLRLGLPLIVVITKLDLASRTGLRANLTKILDALKAAGRKPSIFANQAGETSEQQLDIIKSSLVDKACDIVVPLLNDPIETVPIVLTSAVQGTGIPNLHALLHELPIPAVATQVDASIATIYHIEDIYSKPVETIGVVVSGHLRSGQATVGDVMMLGPFTTQDIDDSEDSDERPFRRSSHSLPASRSFPGALSELRKPSHHLQLPGQEWKRVKIVSIRNLRLPVHSLLAGQVGTLQIVPVEEEGSRAGESASSLARIRKGMVLTPLQPTTTRTFVAEFDRRDLETLAIGNNVVVYMASIRASAKVVSARASDSPITSTISSSNENADAMADIQHGAFDFDEDDKIELKDDQKPHEPVAGAITAQHLQVTFSFVASREFVVLGDKVLVMPGGGPALFAGHGERGQKGNAGLDGFVGKVVETMG